MIGNSSSSANTNEAEKTAVEEHDVKEYEPLSSEVIQQHYNQFPLPPHQHQFMPYEGSETDWVDSSSSVRSDMPHRYLYNQHRLQPQQQQPPTADIDLLNNLHDDIHTSGRYLRCAPSTESLVALLESKRMKAPRGVTATPTPSLPGSGLQSPTAFLSSNDLSAETLVNQQQQQHVPYPAWTDINDLPSYQNIQDIFIDLKNAFGFQYDSMLNMLDHFMVMLDSRASRMTPAMALLTLHADYIGGPNANYRKWYFAAQLNLDDAVGDKNAAINVAEDEAQPQPHTLTEAEDDWRCKMENMTDNDRIRQLALWLMIWGEASVIRFCPEVLCFIFKLADDACKDRLSIIHQHQTLAVEGDYLDNIITPLYDFVKDQVYRKDKHSNFVRRDRDHDSVIGYDDVNQFFWYPETISKLQLQDKTKLASIAAHQRYDSLQHVNWKKAFQKTFKEKRSWMHLAVNFTRIWIIHIVSFWYFIAANSDILYLNHDKKISEKETAVKISMAALGGAVATLLVMLGSFVEYMYVPLSFQKAGILSRRLFLLFCVLILNAGPSVYCIKINRTGKLSMGVALLQLFVSLVTSIFFAVVPQSRLFVRKKRSEQSKKTPANQTFTASFPHLKRADRLISIGLWSCVFGCKLLESYFFIALSFKDPLKAIANMEVLHCRDAITGSILCRYMPSVSLVLMLLMELVLFFLDTYLWYVIWNTLFSVARSFYLGISIWSPWRNTFIRLPKRIYAKILAASALDFQLQPKILCSQVWNALVVSMYREHLLSADHVSKLLYRQIPSVGNTKATLKAPTFFVSQEDVAFKTEYYPQKSEAGRRMQFFAQSLTTPMPESLPVPNMPTFTVMTPHYGEKIILSLREIIREEDKNARITLLEYLKQLHPFEWENFVKDTKVLADEAEQELGDDGSLSGKSKTSTIAAATATDEKTERQHKIDDLPFYCVGFKSAAPEYTLRTRIWASLRSQTLFRTITGFMNYQKAIKLLYRVETPELSSIQGGTMSSHTISDSAADAELEQMARRKFRFVVAMQRYTSFNAEEKESVEYILKSYPDLQIAYLEQEKAEGQETSYYSVLIDGHCDIKPDGTRAPKFRVRLPGNPILGDGKSDNQNTALIYYRGEYLQLIDANQDNYLEECLKIRNVLGEFEEMQASEHQSPYANEKAGKSPVAIVGAREYIFSENVGVLGDIAAGKEQTFGTLTQRIMATIGGRLHYGHPDFLNAIFMTTRGGVSKAQKGLHLNEDIYAGMNAFERGGRIKHVEYFQCGKGRDLGFGSVLNFVTKIGTGMGEQMLSREYYYLGTQLPLDRFLTFFYAHPGFHINNIFIMLSVHMFMFVLLFVGATSVPLTICEFDINAGPDAALKPDGCYNMVPIFEWLKRVVISIFSIIFVAFLPLFLQELTERGFFRAVSRLCKHMLSFSPLFEIFVTQTYANSILNNLSFGGARYIGTGRGFATARLPFSVLYSRFADTSMYSGARLALILLFGSLVLWIPHLAYFWFTVFALVLSPFLFNPHQFALTDFLVDYREYIRWLSRGNGATHLNSWIEFCRFTRMRTTGVKKRQLDPEKPVQQQSRARFTVILFSEIILPLILAILSVTAYLFIRSFDPNDSSKPYKGPSALLRVGIVAMGPILLNAGVLLVLFAVSLFGGCLASLCCGVKFGATIAAVAHGWAVVNFILFFEIFYFLENWSFVHVILGMIAVGSVQRFVFKLMTVLLLTREFHGDQSNQGWWTGRWYGRGLGWHALTQPLREFVCKTIEMSLFATDFIMGHFILFLLFVICLIPGIDKWHSLMLFWLRPKEQIQQHIYSTSQRSRRRRIAVLYGFLLLLLFFAFAGLLVAPAIIGPKLKFKISLPI
ncbi:1,3-beta-glucan synthase component FKS1 [Mucor ambiguus]|uniref:1,3-beta-glucan synthase n=1 Tax=Mucor ambiguus TaxID=91626 RepID=A0A0C9LYA3_9FUNG|nr:1,3-beta-glucan synthase component FKS1 [Mucor ambiguus]